MEIANRQTQRLTKMVDDLLDVARITHGTIPLCKERVVLAHVVQRAVEDTRVLMQERGQRLFVSVPDDVTVDADPPVWNKCFRIC